MKTNLMTHTFDTYNFKDYSASSKLNESAVIEDDKVIFPIKRTYVVVGKYDLGKLTSEVLDGWSNIRSWSNAQVQIRGTQQHENSETAISEFLMDSINDVSIKTLFEAPDLVDFEIIEQKVIFVTEYPTTISTSVVEEGDELKQKFLNDPRFKDVYDEIIREKTKFDRKLEEEEKQRQFDKKENFYHQWKWLEKKRLEGEFDEFLQPHDTPTGL